MSMIKTVHGLGIDELRRDGKEVVRQFVEENQGYLKGRVLDFGCGKQPYKKYCGEYVGYDIGYPDFNGKFDAIMITQVLQYTDNPRDTIETLSQYLKDDGHFLITYSSSWYECEHDDFWRITKAHVDKILNPIINRPILTLRLEGVDINLCYGCVSNNPNKR